MQKYKHILLAVDLHPDCDIDTVEHAKAITRDNQAKLSLVHIVEPFHAYGFAQAYPAMVELEATMVKEATKALKDLAAKHHLKDAGIYVQTGSPKVQIIEEAKKLNVDLIIVGSHGRHGLAAILGSTANAVLHHAPCDVLAVRVHDKKK